MKEFVKSAFLIIWPFILLVIVYGWSSKKTKEKEKKERQEFLSDTAQINAAYRTYERVHRQLLMENPDYAALYEEAEGLKERMKRIKDYAEEAENDLYYFEDKGFDVSDIQDNLNNIIDECE